MTCLGSDLGDAIRQTYAAVATVHFDNVYHRTDIGQKGLSIPDSA